MPRSPSPRGDVVEVCCSSTPEFVSLVRGDWELVVGPRPCVGRGTLRPPLSHSRLLARIIDDAWFSSNWAGAGPLLVQGTPIYLAVAPVWTRAAIWTSRSSLLSPSPVLFWIGVSLVE